MSDNTVALVLCLVLVIISVAAQILLPTPWYPDAPVHRATEQQQLSASNYEVILYVRRLHNDSYVMCAQLPLGDIEGEFLLDSGFKGPAIINTWYAARYRTGVHFEDLGDDAPITPAAALPPYLRSQSITLQGIHGRKTVTVGIHELNCAYAALRHMWSLALPNAPHILTIDTMVKMQPLHLRLRAGASRLSAFLELDAAAKLGQTMKRPQQRWRHGLLEVQVAVDDKLVWCVFDTGLSSSLYLASEVSEPSDRANMKDVNGVTRCLPCKLQTVKLVGVAQSCSVTYGKPCGKRRGYLGMGFLRYFDILLLNNIVYVTESE